MHELCAERCMRDSFGVFWMRLWLVGVAARASRLGSREDDGKGRG